MALDMLNQEIKKVTKDIEDKTFGDILRECRKALGLKLTKASILLGILAYRLNQLEIGFFRKMPKDYELEVISKMYGIDRKMLEKKAEEYVERFRKPNKVSDEEICMYRMQRRAR